MDVSDWHAVNMPENPYGWGSQRLWHIIYRAAEPVSDDKSDISDISECDIQGVLVYIEPAEWIEFKKFKGWMEIAGEDPVLFIMEIESDLRAASEDRTS